MARTAHQAMRPELRRLANHLEAYRKRLRRPRGLPESIWQAAVEVAREHGVSNVARMLRLDYYGLKRRVVAGTDGERGSEAPKFVEIGAANPLLSAGCTIELADGTGRKMTVRVGSGREADLVGLANAFWGASR